MPKYLLLFGDCVWDNRMLTQDCRNLNPNDYLLCYESENSFSAIYCYVSDSWMGILSEGAGSHPERELQDVAVGRFPVTTAAEAKILVDKTINYATNAHAGAWQNTLMFMGDDGNNNLHMTDANDVADDVASHYPNYLVKKVMWDAYTRQTSSTGNTYPEVEKIVKQQQANGALIMDYAGHGSANQMSHENVLRLTDFEAFRNTNLPMWVTASCDIMPFDGTEQPSARQPCSMRRVEPWHSMAPLAPCLPRRISLSTEPSCAVCSARRAASLSPSAKLTDWLRTM